MGFMETLEEDHTEPLIKTPSQLLITVLLSFVIPVGVILLVVQLITGGIKVNPNALSHISVNERIKPIGEIKVVGTNSGEKIDGDDSSIPTKQTDTKTSKSGEAVYNEVCVACHLSGVAGAPKTSDKVAWEPRISKGDDTLYQNAINGIGLMPAKGGGGFLSDDEIRAAVDYMVDNSQ